MTGTRSKASSASGLCYTYKKWNNS